MNAPCILLVGGWDMSLGAGLAMDARVLSHLAHTAASDNYSQNALAATSVLTGVSVQTTDTISGFEAVSTEAFARQLAAVETKGLVVIKTGFFSKAALARAFLAWYGQLPTPIPIITDPVLAPTGGAPANRAYIAAMRELCNQATLITPNQAEAAALNTARLTPGYTLITSDAHGGKGTHIGAPMETGDTALRYHTLHAGGTTHRYTTCAFSGTFRGTGCALTTAIAVHITHGASIPDAVAQGLSFMETAIANHLTHDPNPDLSPIWAQVS